MFKKSPHFAVIDLETTGGLPKRDRIIEVGIVLTDGQQIIDKYHSLIDPERSIPPEITRITGISNEMVSGKPRFYEVARDIVEWTEGRVFVAHNVRFDYGFLQYSYRDLGYTFSRKVLCTARLSRQLFPHLTSHALGSLIRSFDLQVENRHRALDDAMATAELLVRWMNQPGYKSKVHDMINFGVRESKLPDAISLTLLHSLPDQTGVYYFYDRDGELIYIGKAKDIRARVMQHFAPQTNKAEKLQKYVAEIRYELTGSEIAALLKESVEIKRFKPSLNKAQRNSEFPIAIRITESGDDGIKRLDAAHLSQMGTEDHVVGYYPNRRFAQQLIDQRVKDFHLCPEVNANIVPTKLCTSAQIGNCGGICGGLEMLDQYNERVLLASQTLNQLFDRNFIYREEGIHKNEWYLVVVQEGIISKAGYFSDEFGNSSTWELLQSLPDFIGTIEETRIFWKYLRKKKRPEITYLD